MRPIHAAAAGLLLATLDFRTTSIDLLPDVVGFMLLAWAAWAWRDRTMSAIAVLGGVCSIPLLSLPYHRVRVVADTRLGYAELLEYDPLTGLRLIAFACTTTSVGIVMVLMLRSLSRHAAEWQGPSVRRSIRRLRVLVIGFVVVWVLPRLVAAGIEAGDGLEPIWDDPASKIAVSGSVVAVSLAVALLADAREPWAGSVPQRPAPGDVDHEAVVHQ